MPTKYCEKLRYFQDDVENKTEVEENEEDCTGICHKVKLYNVNLISKSTEPLKKDAEEVEKIPEVEIVEVVEEEFETYSFTGKFRDETRRIDLIVVVTDDAKPEAEEMRRSFLMSIIKCGFEIELESGIMKAHKGLIFVKIHAPDNILEEYIEKVGIKKYFKDSHLDYIPAKKMLCIKNLEREWIQLVRNHYETPLRYSNIERSLLVYKVLLQLRFGENQNNFGLQRLLNRNIVADAYALHDGPYFFTKNQDFTHVTGRQILHYNWIGLRHMFKSQPLNLIQEYLGSRVAFYFAFMQFYNLCLILAALAGMIDFVYGNLDDTYKSALKGTCDDEHFRYACPRCLSFDACPFLSFRENYCVVANVVNIIDHRYIYYYSYFVVLWAPIFIIFWRRKEKYWLWMWELLHIRNVTTTRPEFTINYNNPPRSVITGLWKYYNSGPMKYLRSITTLTFLGICVYVAIRLWLNLLNFKYNTLLYQMKSERLPKPFEKFIVVGVFTLICLFVMSIFEKVCQVLAVFVTDFENHRTSESYERSMAIKLFILSFISTFPIMLYYTWYKSRLFYIPGRPYHTSASKSHSKFYYGYTRNCGPLPCIDEVCVSLTIIFMYKQVLPNLFRLLKYIFYNARTDYNQGKKINQRIPCWEREYRLNSITASDMIKKYNNLAMQIALVTWYVPSSPLIPLAALIINLIDTRITAREFLMSSRRPLLHERMGVDIWSNIFTIVSFASISTNAVLLAWSTRVAKRYYYLTLFKDLKNFFEYYVSVFLSKDFITLQDTSYLYYHYPGLKPYNCYFPGNMPTLEQFYKDNPGFPSLYYYYPRSVPVTEYWFTKVYEDLLLSLFQFSALLLVLLVYFLFTPSFKDVEDSMKTEENIKEAYITHTSS